MLERDQAELIARQHFDERMSRLDGHKVATWESISDLMREHLIYIEQLRSDDI